MMHAGEMRMLLQAVCPNLNCALMMCNILCCSSLSVVIFVVFILSEVLQVKDLPRKEPFSEEGNKKQHHNKNKVIYLTMLIYLLCCQDANLKSLVTDNLLENNKFPTDIKLLHVLINQSSKMSMRLGVRVLVCLFYYIFATASIIIATYVCMGLCE